MYHIKVYDDGEIEVLCSPHEQKYVECVTKDTEEAAIQELVDYGVERDDAEAAVYESKDTDEWVIV